MEYGRKKLSFKNAPRPDIAKDEQALRLASMIFGEGTGQPIDVLTMIGSTAINRLNSPNDKLYGADLDGVLTKPNQYYAVGGNVPWKEASSLNFKSSKDANEFDTILSLAEELISGSINPTPGKFYFKDNEAKSLKKRLQFLRRSGDYGVYDEKAPSKK